MDLSAKRQQLEALRAARLKKQQLVDQFAGSGPAAATGGTPATAPEASAKTAQTAPAVESGAHTRPASSPRSAPTPMSPSRLAVASQPTAAPNSSTPTTFAPQSLKPAPAALQKPIANNPNPRSPVSAASAGTALQPATAASATTSTTQQPAPVSPTVVVVAPTASSSPKGPGTAHTAVKPASPPTTPPKAPHTPTPSAPAVAAVDAAPRNRATATGESQRSAGAPAPRPSPMSTPVTESRTADTAPATASTHVAPPSHITAGAGEGGLGIFHRWGSLAEEGVDLARCAPACALSGKLLLGSKGRLIRSTAVTQVPVQLNGSTQHELAPCVIAAYARPPALPTGTAASTAGPARERSPCASELVVSGSNSVTGMEHSLLAGGGRVSPTHANSVLGGTAADEPEHDMAVRDAGLSDAGYAWGTSAASRTHRFAGPSPSNTASQAAGSAPQASLTGAALKQRMRRLVKSAAGLAVAWTVVVLHELDDGSVADTMTVMTPLVCDSEINCLAVDPQRPCTLYGGLRCGRLVCWSLHDEWHTLSSRQLRAKAVSSSGSDSTYLLRPRRPTLSTFPSPLAHQGPVLQIAIQGDQSAPQIHSVSQEGKVCTWSALDLSLPTTSRSAYNGSRFLGSLASTAGFTTMRSTGAIMDVILGTSTGTVLRGVNRDNRVIDLTSLWRAPARTTSSEQAGSGGGAASSSRSPERSMGADSVPSPIGASQANVFSSPLSGDLARMDRSGASAGSSAAMLGPTTNGVMNTWGLGLGSATSGATSPHLGIVTAVAVQPLSLTATTSDSNSSGGGGGRACVVSAATDGSCVAWTGDTAVPLSGFLSVVTCLRWSPTHPHLFAAGDAFGLVTLWNLVKSVTVPLAKVMLGAPLLTTRSEDVNSPVLPLHPGIKRGKRAADYLGDPLEGRIRAQEASTQGDDNDDAARDTASPSDTDLCALEEADVVAPGDGAVAVTSLTFSPDGRWLFAANASGAVYVLMLSKTLWG